MEPFPAPGSSEPCVLYHGQQGELRPRRQQIENNPGVPKEFKKVPEEVLEAISGGVDISGYSKEDLANIFHYFEEEYGTSINVLAPKLAPFGVTADDIDQSRRIAVANGSTSFWPWYLADMLMERNAYILLGAGITDSIERMPIAMRAYGRTCRPRAHATRRFIARPQHH